MTLVCILIIALTSTVLWCWISKNGADEPDNGDSCLGNQSGAISLQLAYWFTFWSAWYHWMPFIRLGRFWIAVKFWYIQSENGFPFGMRSVFVNSCMLVMKMWIFQESDELICLGHSIRQLTQVFDSERNCIARMLLALESVEDNTTNAICLELVHAPTLPLGPKTPNLIQT